MRSVLISQCLLSEDAGRQPCVPFKKINKMIDIVIADFAAYFMDGPVRGQQHFFGFFKAPSDQVFQRRQPVRGRKLPAETVFAYVEKSLAFIEGKALVIMMFQKVIQFCKITGNILFCSGIQRLLGKAYGA